jgi:hypothetical protein
MYTIRTIEDLLHAITNGMTLISSHAQYLLGKHSRNEYTDELNIIRDEAERVAKLLNLVPHNLAKSIKLDSSDTQISSSDMGLK